jgi:hypothetical protein
MHYAIRHGENLLLPIKSIPKGAKSFKTYIVGHSESGHHHVLESKANFEVIDDKEKQELYLRLFEPAKLVHKKQFDAHKTLTVPAGMYRVIRKQEYNPWEEVMQNVFD